MKSLCVGLFLVLALATTAQAPDPPLELTKEDQLRLRTLQYKQAQVALEMQNLRIRLSELNMELSNRNQELNLAVREIVKKAGKDPDGYEFRPDPLEIRPHQKLKGGESR